MADHGQLEKAVQRGMNAITECLIHDRVERCYRAFRSIEPRNSIKDRGGFNGVFGENHLKFLNIGRK